MIELNDKRWKEFEGGYKIPYDVSIPLRKLEQISTPNESEAIFIEFWQELHHQGDVGLASYFAVPHIIRIAIEKKLINYNVFGLVATIEIQRHKDNPRLPEEFIAAYLESLKKGIPELIRLCINDKWDLSLTTTILSALAVSKNQINIAEAVLNMDDNELVMEFLDKF